MGTTVNLFPARVPFGRATDANGRSFDVLMTPEFSRALSDLMLRIGGTNNFSTDELAALICADPNDTAALATLQRTVMDQAAQLAAAASVAARMAALERKIADLHYLVSSTGPAPVDWEHPGKIGDKTPNSARVTTLNKITFTQPAVSATCTLATGKTFTVSNTLTLSGTDGSTLNIGAGGTLGSAAYKNVTDFAIRSNTALAAVATDPASTQALANSLRAVLISVGIGT